MFDQILALVKQCGESSIVNNADVPNEHNNAAISASAETIFKSLSEAVTKGGLPQLMGLMSGGSSPDQSSIVKNITDSLSKRFVSDFSLPSDAAQRVAGQTIEGVMKGLLTKLSSSQPQDLMALAQGFMNDQSGSLLSALDVNKDGAITIDDAVAKLAGGENGTAANGTAANGTMAAAGKFLSGMLK